ncbi:MAG: nucleoside phosphorylase [Bacteroidaceae bacterium]|nr:nucleoside phosphorylase [Bacteroidaceae bacterium]
METKYFPESELIINADGSAFHIHVRPDQLCDKIILVGDPGRVDMVASYFDEKTFEASSREFHTIGGVYKGKKVMCISHGIGTDNIDIVVNELDALANIDFETRREKPEHRTLSMVRIGTCGGLQSHVPIGTHVVSEKSIGFDGVLNFYAGRNEVCDLAFEEDFCKSVGWNPLWAHPYVIDNDPDLVNRIDCGDVVRGVTISANGFYGPQGRELRAPLADPDLNAKIQAFKRDRYVVTNYEMESSALAGLAALLGHKAMTVCLVIANRVAHHSNTNYKSSMGDLIVKVLDRI